MSDKYTIIGESEAIQTVMRLVAKIAPSDATVLIEGESGTGKELVARAIHDLSARREQNFLSLNCGSIPRDLLESTLFGHVKGSFTGAVNSSQGMFRAAEKGTFFLDEIGVMPMETQVRMLRVLQEREVFPVGSSEPVKVQCRVLAATNQPMMDMVEQGKFRPDLYYRLNVVRIKLPPMRSRKEDIEPLVMHFLSKLDPDRPKRINLPALNSLTRYTWPGNVRQLENSIISACLMDTDGTIGVEDLPEEIVRPVPKTMNCFVNPPTYPLRYIIDEYVRQVLEYCGSSKSKAAHILGVNPSTLYRWSLSTKPALCQAYPETQERPKPAFRGSGWRVAAPIVTSKVHSA
jgi:transcriptional regulator with PAS, ATPase and Fis domain